MKYMFHVSRKDLGSVTLLEPKVPATRHISECNVTDRVCFSPTIQQCLIGIVGNSQTNLVAGDFHSKRKEFKNLTVYATDEELEKPSKGIDFETTDEHWSTRPSMVKRVGYVDMATLFTTGKVKLTQSPTSPYTELSEELPRVSLLKRNPLDVVIVSQEEMKSVFERELTMEELMMGMDSQQSQPKMRR